MLLLQHLIDQDGNVNILFLIKSSKSTKKLGKAKVQKDVVKRVLLENGIIMVAKFLMNLQTHEVNIMQRLKSVSGVAQIVEASFTIYKNKICILILLPLYEQGDLFSVVEFGPCPREFALNVTRQLTNVLFEMHNNFNIAHRDLKLENVFLDKFGNAFLGDFGFACTLDSDTYFQICGSYSTASPELLNGTSCDPLKNDVFALGACLWMILTCKPIDTLFLQKRGFVYGVSLPVDDDISQLLHNMMLQDSSRRSSIQDVKLFLSQIS
jgi:serine/threonine protein kinase